MREEEREEEELAVQIMQSQEWPAHVNADCK